jgi:hypothetical protein
MSVFHAALHRRGDMKSLVNIKKLRAHKDTYYWLLNNFAPLVAGAETFKKQVKKVLPTVWCTASSEAFMVLCLENYYSNVQDIATNSNGVRKPLWTSEGRGARRNQGWSQTGIEKFDSYCRLVTANRVKDASKKIDEEYQEEKQSAMNKAEERKRKREETRKDRETGWNVAHVDEWSDEEAPIYGADGEATEGGRESEGEKENEQDQDESDIF